MKNFDFLSDSPKIFIFKKDSNKTNFGGILFLISNIYCNNDSYFFSIYIRICFK